MSLSCKGLITERRHVLRAVVVQEYQKDGMGNTFSRLWRPTQRVMAGGSNWASVSAPEDYTLAVC